MFQNSGSDLARFNDYTKLYMKLFLQENTCENVWINGGRYLQHLLTQKSMRH